MAYFLDANVFIQAKNLHCGLVCPAFWDWLDRENANGKVFSIQRVSDELQEGGDELADWATQRPAFFLEPKIDLPPALRAVSTWATSQGYEMAAVNTFLQVADYYLVGQAVAQKHIIVTHEIASTSIRKIKIPDACIGLGIRCLTPFEMLRRERARSFLGHKFISRLVIAPQFRVDSSCSLIIFSQPPPDQRR